MADTSVCRVTEVFPEEGENSDEVERESDDMKHLETGHVLH